MAGVSMTLVSVQVEYCTSDYECDMKTKRHGLKHGKHSVSDDTGRDYYLRTVGYMEKVKCARIHECCWCYLIHIKYVIVVILRLQHDIV